MSSLRTQGPITTGGSFAKGVCCTALSIDHAVWVPAFAGTTVSLPRARFRMSNSPEYFFRRHCEERSDEAIHAAPNARRNGLLRFARNDGGASIRTPKPPAAPRARGFASSCAPRKFRGRRESRVPSSTRDRAHKMHTGDRKVRRNTRPSLRNGFTADGALSPATNSSCHRR